MLEFQPLTKEAITSFVPFLSGHNGRFCDYTPVNLFIWKDYFYKGYAVCDGMLYLELLGEDGESYYAVPMGDGDVVVALRNLKEYTDRKGEPLRLSIVSKDMLRVLETTFGCPLDADCERQWADYMYDAQRMARFEGSDYAKQRNHVRRFEKQYPSYRVEWLSPSHLPEVFAFLDTFADIRGKQSELALEEIERTKQALQNMRALSLFGVVLYVDDTLVGFSAGCRLDDTLYVNFEKADTSYSGVYQMLVKQFASAFADESIAYINREEDCGDEGLRKSKLAYHPIDLFDKYTVVIE